MTNASLKTKIQSLFKKSKRPSKKEILNIVGFALISAALFMAGFCVGVFWDQGFGQASAWDKIRMTETQLLGLYSNSTQTQLKALLPSTTMNFTDGLLWESQKLVYTETDLNIKMLFKSWKTEKVLVENLSGSFARSA